MFHCKALIGDILGDRDILKVPERTKGGNLGHVTYNRKKAHRFLESEGSD